MGTKLVKKLTATNISLAKNGADEQTETFENKLYFCAGGQESARNSPSSLSQIRYRAF